MALAFGVEFDPEDMGAPRFVHGLAPWTRRRASAPPWARPASFASDWFASSARAPARSAADVSPETTRRENAAIAEAFTRVAENRRPRRGRVRRPARRRARSLARDPWARNRRRGPRSVRRAGDGARLAALRYPAGAVQRAGAPEPDRRRRPVRRGDRAALSARAAAEGHDHFDERVAVLIFGDDLSHGRRCLLPIICCAIKPPRQSRLRVAIWRVPLHDRQRRAGR